MINVFVYGSLKRGLFNHSLISDNQRNRFIKRSVIDGYKMYLLYSYPAIKPSSTGDKIYTELYSISEEVFDRIDLMERSAGYTPIEVSDEDGKTGIIYVYDRDVDESKVVASGNWTKLDEKIRIIG